VTWNPSEDFQEEIGSISRNNWLQIGDFERASPKRRFLGQQRMRGGSLNQANDRSDAGLVFKILFDVAEFPDLGTVDSPRGWFIMSQMLENGDVVF
jgi:hypothetical protein